MKKKNGWEKSKKLCNFAIGQSRVYWGLVLRIKKIESEFFLTDNLYFQVSRGMKKIVAYFKG